MSTKIEGLPIQKDWKVVGVREGKETDNPNGGKLKAFYVDFSGASDVYWRRKMPASVEAGKSYFGTVSEGEHGPMFKKETPDQNRTTGQTSSASGGSRDGGRDWKPESAYDPEKVARIGRAHAQEMALRMAALTKPPEPADPELAPRWTVTDVLALADGFEADVNRAAASGVENPSTSSPQGVADPSVAVVAEAPDPEYVLKVVEDSGLSRYPALKLHAFILRMTADQQQRAVAGLADPQTQVVVLANLKNAYVKTEGEELPLSDPADDDIPF